MVGTILSGIIGVLFLIGAVMQYRCRGPIWSAEYIASSQKERKRLRKKRTYFWSATCCLMIGLSLILLMLYGLTEITGFMYGVCVPAILLFVLLILGSVSAVRKSTERGQDAVMRRENLDDVFPDEVEEEFRRRRRASRQKRTSGQGEGTMSSAQKQRVSRQKKQRESIQEQRQPSGKAVRPKGNTRGK